MTSKTSSNEMPSKYKPMTGGNLPPFVSMQVGDILEATVVSVRAVTKAEKVKSGGKMVEVEKERMYYDLALTKPFHNVTKDRKGKVTNEEDFAAGDKVTLSGRGILDYAFQKAALEAAGEKSLPKERSEWPQADYTLLAGVPVFIGRTEDRPITKGEWKGKDAHAYNIGFGVKA